MKGQGWWECGVGLVQAHILEITHGMNTSYSNFKQLAYLGMTLEFLAFMLGTLINAFLQSPLINALVLYLMIFYVSIVLASGERTNTFKLYTTTNKL